MELSDVQMAGRLANERIKQDMPGYPRKCEHGQWVHADITVSSGADHHVQLRVECMCDLCARTEIPQGSRLLALAVLKNEEFLTGLGIAVLDDIRKQSQ